MVSQLHNFNTLDLSWCRLGPLHLHQIAKTLKKNPNQIKNLNLGYNNLCFDPNFEEKMNSSEEFIDELCHFLAKSTSLNHIDLSGLVMKP